MMYVCMLVQFRNRTESVIEHVFGNIIVIDRSSQNQISECLVGHVNVLAYLVHNSYKAIAGPYPGR